jgi:hypothetical protein
MTRAKQLLRDISLLTGAVYNAEPLLETSHKCFCSPFVQSACSSA